MASCAQTTIYQDGRYCYSIAAQFNISLEDLYKLNPGIPCDNLQTGDLICVAGPIVKQRPVNSAPTGVAPIFPGAAVTTTIQIPSTTATPKPDDTSVRLDGSNVGKTVDYTTLAIVLAVIGAVLIYLVATIIYYRVRRKTEMKEVSDHEANLAGLPDGEAFRYSLEREEALTASGGSSGDTSGDMRRSIDTSTSSLVSPPDDQGPTESQLHHPVIDDEVVAHREP